MAAFTAIAAGVGAATGLIGSAASAAGAAKNARRARGAQAAAAREIASIKSSRQQIINPYEGAKDLSNMAKDLSSGLSNPFASLGVATQSAEIQMEQTDMALANTLDTLRSTGASAGGATALAQAALQSKKGVAANIEQQEAQNEKLKAQGEQQLQQQKMSEQQRLQSISISEGQRLQASDAAGKQFEFGAQEARTNQDLNRAAGQQQQAMQSEADANAAKASAIMGGVSAIGSIGAAYAGKPAE
tara:strand:+ start:546 stop:1280 length:735 start_codon:yes stop_codon:yes gene_type:complete